jgi:hypothetical protein
VVTEHRLEPVLGEVAQRRGGDDVEFGESVLALEGDAAELVTRQGRDPPHPGTLLGRGAGRQHPVHVDAGRPEDLEGAGTDHVGGRRRQRSCPALDDHVVDPLLGEEERGDQPHRTAADHQYGRRPGQSVERRRGGVRRHRRPS